MKEYAQIFIIGVAIVATGVGITEFGYRMRQHYGPLNEEVRRDTFEQSRAFNEGTQRDIENLRLEWMKATPEQKIGIRAIALHRIYGLPDRAKTADIIEFQRNMEAFQ